MGKKKKFKKLAESNIQILSSGKLKITKGEKIDISSFVAKSVENTIISRLDAIISKEDVIIDTDKIEKPTITNMLVNPVFSAEMATQSSAFTPTIIIPVNKKAALDVFDYLSFDTLGILLRSSTLASCYKKVKNQWVDLNKDDGSSFTNVLFIPEVMIFLDFTTGKIRKTPINVNVLMVVVPPISKMNDSIEKVSLEDACSRIVVDMVESAIRCGCKNIVVDPYAHKTLLKDIDLTAKLWHQITTTEKFIENFRNVVFSMESEKNFIAFNTKTTTVDGVTITEF